MSEYDYLDDALAHPEDLAAVLMLGVVILCMILIVGCVA